MQNLESVSNHNKKGNDGMDRLAKIARSQLSKVVELAKPAKMVKGSTVSQICKTQPKASEKIPKDSKVC